MPSRALTLGKLITSNDTINSTQFPATGVTSGSYTNADITVASDGRISSASNGTGLTSITSISYSGDDLAVDITNPLPITITGANFEANSLVYVDTISATNAATSLTYSGTTQITCTPPAKSAASYNLWIVGPSGRLTVLANGLLYSGTPNWSGQSTSLTSASTAVSIQLSATGDTPLVYTLVSGTLPTGVTLNSSGLISGTATGLTQTTTFSNLVIRASDPQNQDASITINLTVQVAHQISRSLRFNSADSAYLSRTPASAGNQKTYTVSVWLKRSAIGASGFSFLSVGTSTGGPRSDWAIFQDYLAIGFNPSGGTWLEVDTSALYRDVSAWYHVVVAVDTTQATSTDRVKLYVNGSLVTAFLSASYPSQNSDTLFNGTGVHAIGRYNAASSNYYSGYMAEYYMIDGQAITPSSFGQTNSNTGVWEPKAYSGTYGTNGFYLNFSDNSGTTSTTLGKDYSGNGNNWTPNNFSVTAGAGNDSLVDTPTSYGTDTSVGGEVRGNYATINPNFYASSWAASSVTNGALDFTASGNETRDATMAVSSGKWYYEQVYVSDTHPSAQPLAVGIRNIGNNNSNYATSDANYWYVYGDNGYKRHNGVDTSYLGSGMSNGDVIMCAFDLDSGKIWWGKNGTWAASGNPATGANAAFTDLAGYTVTPFAGGGGSYSVTSTFNFGQRPFAYTAPSGFKALCTQNLATPAVVKGSSYFNTITWSGDSVSGRSLTGVGFQPDWVWIKNRNAPAGHNISDAVRGANKRLNSDNTGSEATNSGYGYTSAFNSDGFVATAGNVSGYELGDINMSGRTYVAWNWKANGAGSSNTAGSITSTVSANTTSGFSVVTYTGTGSNATVGHGLGVAPSMIICKRRSATENWCTYHASLGATKAVFLNLTDAVTTNVVFFNNTAPTSSLFSVGTNASVNANTSTYVAYCFAAISGYSAFGSYTGNGSTDGPFVFTGMRPAFILIKNSSATGYWVIFDVARNTYNAMTSQLWPNVSDTENNTYGVLDAVSNGFKLRNTAAGYNDNGSTYIYACFASNPFKYALAR